MEVVKENAAQQALQTIKILIADDDPPTRMLLRAAVTKWGYEVIEANDGEEAWKLLQEPNKPDLLILDWLMPNLDGPGLCERIKKELPFIPYIILLTQVSGTTNIIKGLEAGADEFLSKPFNMAELRSRLSVGSRIVNYKKQLEQQNKQIAESDAKSNQVIKLISEISKKISELQNSLQNSNTNSELTKNIFELQTNLTKLTETLSKNNVQK